MAKDLLKSVYKVREVFKHVRSPIMGYEYPKEMTNNFGHLEDKHNFEGMHHVYHERWKHMIDAFQELENRNLEALVEWGSEYQYLISPLRKCRSDVLLAIGDELKRYQNPGLETLTGREKINAEKLVLDYIGENSELDKFTVEINSAVENFEKWLRPHVNPK